MKYYLTLDQHDIVVSLRYGGGIIEGEVEVDFNCNSGNKITRDEEGNIIGYQVLTPEVIVPKLWDFTNKLWDDGTQAVYEDYLEVKEAYVNEISDFNMLGDLERITQYQSDWKEIADSLGW